MKKYKLKDLKTVIRESKEKGYNVRGNEQGYDIHIECVIDDEHYYISIANKMYENFGREIELEPYDDGDGYHFVDKSGDWYYSKEWIDFGFDPIKFHLTSDLFEVL